MSLLVDSSRESRFFRKILFRILSVQYSEPPFGPSKLPSCSPFALISPTISASCLFPYSTFITTYTLYYVKFLYFLPLRTCSIRNGAFGSCKLFSFAIHTLLRVLSPNRCQVKLSRGSKNKLNKNNLICKRMVHNTDSNFCSLAFWELVVYISQVRTATGQRRPWVQRTRRKHFH
jgi:hypothetical protein